ncbi:hypothetical protein NYE40_23075 [Paenibacillus sp. FSL W8-1187]|uniref:Uracil-DNA glycosylase-like domain-containing protein n=1 Tax=Paenibacillus pasadenensis TaxID=217090 RepID=A0A2N5NCY8_9BACL|nr:MULTISPECIES: hypothetical protein [Paenibacillus]PLT48205.1 hypothetical protein B8V81_0337 [Paenibacillus pasadenensis]QGG58284.1 hypothetical protein GE073_23705 [Paenibacillus sp. B01]
MQRTDNCDSLPQEEPAQGRVPDSLKLLRWPERFEAAAAYMAALPDRERYSREELLAEPLLLSREGALSIYYAPHNELAAPDARLIIAGLTPGWRQMEISLRAMRACLAAGAPPAEACRQARREARFAGPMRTDLLGMLGRLGLPEALDAALGRHDDWSLLDHPLVHTTSVLPCPVFRDGANYSGHQPPLRRSPLLWQTAMGHLEDELSRLKRPALLLPLGKAAEDAASELVRRGLLPEERLLRGFPHPSGANGHRFVQFERAYPELKAKLDRFFAHESGGPA